MNKSRTFPSFPQQAAGFSGKVRDKLPIIITGIAVLALAGFWFALPRPERTPQVSNNQIQSQATGNAFYAAPAGSASGDGSINNPWDLKTAFNHPAAVKPGGTIYLRGGTYTGLFVSNLNGTASAPITVRSYPGEWAKIDGGASGAAAPSSEEDVVVVEGSYAWYMDLEILRSGFTRGINRSGCGVNRGGIDFNSGNNKLINAVIHDTSIGVGAFRDAPNTEIYGNIIYYNGWFELLGKLRPCDHGFYGQNKTGTKLIQDNIVFENFATGITPHGTAAVELDNFTIEGNTIFNTGEIGRDPVNPGRHIWWGNLGGPVAKNPVIIDNYLYYSPNHLPGAGSLFLLSPSSNARITGNYLMRGDVTITSQQVSTNLNFSGNHIWGGLVGFGQVTYPNNTYYTAKPGSNAVFLRPNKYDPGRANVTIYNWQNLSSVSVDVSSLGWTAGTAYRLRNAQNYFSDIISGIYSGSGAISVPMIGRTLASAVGVSAPGSTFPEFGVFVVERTGSAAPSPQPSPVQGEGVHPEGTLVNDNGTIFLITGGQRRGFRTANEFFSYGYQFSQAVIANAADRGLPIGAVMRAKDGTVALDTADNRTVFLIAGGAKRGFTSAEIFFALGYSFSQVIPIDLSDYPEGPVMP